MFPERFLGVKQIFTPSPCLPSLPSLPRVMATSSVTQVHGHGLQIWSLQHHSGYLSILSPSCRVTSLQCELHLIPSLSCNPCWLSTEFRSNANPCNFMASCPLGAVQPSSLRTKLLQAQRSNPLPHPSWYVTALLSGLQSVVPTPTVASAAAGNLSEVQVLRPSPRLAESETMGARGGWGEQPFVY